MPLTTSGGFAAASLTDEPVHGTSRIGNAIPDTSVVCQHGRFRSSSHRAAVPRPAWGVGLEA
jgi:hypothetical protein